MQRPPMIEPAPIAVTLVDAPVPLPQGDEPSRRSEAPPLPEPAPVPVRTPVAQLPLPPEHKLVEPIEPPPPVTPPEEPPPPQPAAEVPTAPPPMEPSPNAITAPPPPTAVAQAPPAPPAAPTRTAPAQEPEVDSGPLFTAAYLHNPKPEYPALSRRMGEQGLVLLRVFVGASGEARTVELKQPCGHRRLDEAALDAVRRWKFVPAKRGEQTVDAWVVVPIRFSLKG